MLLACHKHDGSRVPWNLLVVCSYPMHLLLVSYLLHTRTLFPGRLHDLQLTLSWLLLPPVDVNKPHEAAVLNRHGNQHQVLVSVLLVRVKVVLQTVELNQALAVEPQSTPIKL